jgi:hypothetical protein
MFQVQVNQNLGNSNTSTYNNLVHGGGSGPLLVSQIPVILPNINFLDFMDDTDNECNVATIKRTRALNKERMEGEKLL